MNIWNAIDTLGAGIKDDRLRAAWARLLETRTSDDCEYAAWVADRVPGQTAEYVAVASRAADLARAEQRLFEALINAGVKP